MNVRMTPIGEVLELRRQQIGVDPFGRYRQVGLRSFGRGIFGYNECAGSELGKLRYFTLAPDRLVVSNIKGWEGAVAVSGPNESGRMISNRFLTYSAKGPVDLEYVAHWLLSDAGLEALGRASPGSADRNRTLAISRFEAIKVPLPDPPKQRRIAEHLGKFDHVSRQAFASDTVHSERIGALIEAAVREASGNASRPVGALLERDREWFEPGKNEAYSPIGVRGFGRGIIHYPEVPRDELAKLRFYRVQPERLLVSNIKAWEGAVTVTTEVDHGRIASNRFLQYRLVTDITSLDWIRTYLLSRAGLAQLQKASPGSADRNRTLSMDAFESVVVPVPPPKEQSTVLAVANRAVALQSVRRRRLAMADAILPAARNEVFSALR